MHFTLGCNFDQSLIQRISTLNSIFPDARVNELYGSEASHASFSARPAYRLPKISPTAIEKYIYKCREHNIGFNYTMNSFYCGSKKELLRKYKNLKNHIQWLIEIGVTTITISNPIFAEIIRDVSSDVNIAVSTIAHLDSISQVELWKEIYGINKLYGNVSKNRSVRFLENLSQVCKANNVELCLLVNEFCYNGSLSDSKKAAPCIFRDSCYLFHSETKTSEEDLLFNRFPMNHCMKSRKHPATWLKSRFIRPEDTYLYKDIGIDHFKITGRTASTEYLEKIAFAYLSKNWEGNLLALWKPLETILTPMASEFSFEHELFIDNKKLSGFLEFWFNNPKHECADEICGQTCNYCNQFVKRCTYLMS